MAPNVDLLSYGTQGYGAGDILFYNNVPDIEADFATAQNSYGADLANVSLGSNIYDNDPEDCWVMGLYGSASVLIDQIIRGGNPVVGTGDRYITPPGRRATSATALARAATPTIASPHRRRPRTPSMWALPTLTTTP